MPKAPTVADYIEEALRERGGEAKTGELLEAVMSRTDSSESSVRNALVSLKKEGRVEQPRYGYYALSGQDNGQEAVEAEEEREMALMRIPHLSVEVSAGDGSEVHLVEEEGATHLPKWYVRQEFGVSPERVKRIRVKGDSMKPTLLPGQYVYVVIVKDELPQSDAIYVLYGPEGLQIKRLRFEAETYVTENGNGETEDVKRYIWIWSDNEEAGRYRVPLEVFERDYRLIAYLRKKEEDL